MTTGEKIKQLRKKQALSQEQLADLLGLSRQAVSRWETENALPETGIIVKLSGIFNVTTDYLLKENENEQSDVPPSGSSAPPPGRNLNLMIGVAAVSFSVISFLIVFFISLSTPILKEGTYGMLDWNFWVWNDITVLAAVMTVTLAVGIYHLGKYYFRDDSQDPPPRR